MRVTSISRWLTGLTVALLILIPAAQPALAQSAVPDANSSNSQLQVSPKTLNYNIGKNGTSQTKSFTIKNLGGADLDVTIGDPSNPDYEITSGNGGNQTIPGKGKLVVMVTFAPPGPTKKDNGEIDISSDATKGKQDAVVKLKGKSKQSAVATATPTATATATATQTATATATATRTATATATPTAT